MIKGSIHQEDKTMIKYVHLTTEPWMHEAKEKLTELKGEIDSSKIIFGNFSISLLIMDRMR